MKTEDLLGLAVPLLFVLLLTVESRTAARAYEPMRRWRWTGTTFFVLTLLVGSITPLLLPLDTLKAHSLLDLSAWGVWGVPVGVLTTSFFGYWLHRAEHRFNWLWRASHQLHHSPVRVDLLGAFFAHPLEVVIKVTLGTLVGSFLLGLGVVAAAAVGLVTAGLSMFQHWNIRTPRVLGYFLQRPESHCLHHERDVHARNFSDLPLWDMLFGTFHNPPRFEGRVGFGSGAPVRIADLLLMRDVDR